jgi:hypothetical protein
MAFASTSPLWLGAAGRRLCSPEVEGLFWEIDPVNRLTLVAQLREDLGRRYAFDNIRRPQRGRQQLPAGQARPALYLQDSFGALVGAVRLPDRDSLKVGERIQARGHREPCRLQGNRWGCQFRRSRLTCVPLSRQ